MSKLVEIRCPFKYRSKKDNKTYSCNHLCCKVRAGSSGEAWCAKCQLSFEFEVNTQLENKTSVRVKS